MTSSNRPIAVLIAEDSLTQAQRLEHTLRGQGHRVRHAVNGRVALQMAREEKPDMIISDVIMPEMDGYELCLSVKSDPALADVPVILVTTLSDPADVIRGLESRADNFILKPYEDTYLLNRVHYILLNRDMQNGDRGEMAVRIYFNGRRHLITADRMQILNLLLSTYEAAIERNKELTRSKQALAERGVALADRQRALDDANSFLENIIAASPSIIYRFEPSEDLLVTYVSPNIGSILGYSVGEVVGVPDFWIHNIHPDERESARRTVSMALLENCAHIEQEFRKQTKQGSYRWFLTSMRVEYDEQARPTGILCHSLDIHDRKRAEEETRQAETFLSSLVENVPSTIFVKDARDFRYVRLNRAFEQLTGYQRAEVLGKTDAELFPAPEAERFLAADQQALATGELIDIGESSVTVTRGVRLLHTRKIPIFDGSDRAEYLLGISDDVTERANNERALAAAKQEAERANRAKSEFLSRMSHELRTPLNAILGFAQLLEADSVNEEQRESVAHILKGGAHLLELINEVLDIARIEAGHISLSPEPVAIHDVVGQVAELVRPLAAQRRIAIDVREAAGAEGGHVLADRQRLSQVLLNLLSNAVKYNREGGRVAITFADGPADTLRVKVTDTGAGIPAAKLPLLFQPFERLGAEQSGIEGTGLGLALSRALVVAMGGTLGVESVLDAGSTFWVELPVADPPSDVRGGSAEPARSLLGENTEVTGTVLYIEDNPSNWRLMQRILARRPGIRLVGVAQGQAGIELARAEPPDLVLLDLHLPDMHGEEVLRLLQEDPRTRQVRVAVLSADATPQQAKRLLASGASAFLTKPVNLQAVLHFVDETMDNGVDRSSTGGMAP